MRFFFCVTFVVAAHSASYCQVAGGAPAMSGTGAQSAWQLHAARSHALLMKLNESVTEDTSPLPQGVTELKFSELFGPIGDRGLEYSAKLRALDGSRVRISGFMLREQEHSPGIFLLAGRPATVATKGACSIDNAPPSVIHVMLASPKQAVPYRPGHLVISGRIQIGPRLEVDGRNSIVRVLLDDGASSQFSAAGSNLSAELPHARQSP